MNIRSVGFTERMKDYRFRGKTGAAPEPGRCVMRNVLHRAD
ncbi:MAG TPA: hypothetical protein VHC46_06610 [Thermodesulfobacteriota bacterium]|nr:hypothetical protein [Thermodesulfobacteriota bacterium]